MRNQTQFASAQNQLQWDSRVLNFIDDYLGILRNLGFEFKPDFRRLVFKEAQMIELKYSSRIDGRCEKERDSDFKRDLLNFINETVKNSNRRSAR